MSKTDTKTRHPDGSLDPSLLECLRVLGEHEQLHFFDITDDREFEMRTKEKLNPLLPLLMKSVFDSPDIKVEDPRSVTSPVIF